MIISQGDSPDHEPGCDVEAIEEAKEQWKVLMKQGPHVVNIQMSNIAAFGKLCTGCILKLFIWLLTCFECVLVEVKAIFNSQRIKADSSAILDVYLRYNNVYGCFTACRVKLLRRM